MRGTSKVCNATLAHINARSLVSHFGSIREHALLKKYTFFLISETWLTREISDSEVAITGYRLFRKDRDGRGGGVAMYIANSICNIEMVPVVFKSCEAVFVSFSLNQEKIVLGTVYRPPGFRITVNF
nr:unnamed protein product [Callosobruchus chinensis]